MVPDLFSVRFLTLFVCPGRTALGRGVWPIGRDGFGRGRKRERRAAVRDRHDRAQPHAVRPVPDRPAPPRRRVKEEDMSHEVATQWRNWSGYVTAQLRKTPALRPAPDDVIDEQIRTLVNYPDVHSFLINPAEL
jgi:hypothetical protein